MTTAYDIIRKAMQKAGILTKTETPDFDEQNDAFDALNAMLSSWSNESILAYARVRESFPLTTGVGEYTIGPGQTFDTVRPISIVAAFVRWDITDYPLMEVTDEDYATVIWNKSIQSLPESYNYDNGYPTARIRLWPVPVQAYTLHLYSEKPLVEFTQLNEVVSLPPGWERALIYNLAIELAPEYGVQIDPVVADIARQAKGSIQRAIMKVRTMDATPNYTGRKRDIMTDRT